ncbi:MAG: prepilin peptidase [bacterium]|nr:prepilin peptidase [bacterium]
MAFVPQPVMIAYACLIGAVVGSFLNVVVYRIPRGKSIVFPGSTCPQCKNSIRWFDNIPLVSWIILGARCRRCSAPISMRYPFVEALAAIAAGLGVFEFGIGLVTFEVVIFAWASIALALIDFEHQILPDVITIPAIVFGLAMSWAGSLVALWEALIGCALGAALPTAVILLYKLIRGEEGMGWGDVKYLAAIGAVTGVYGCLWVLIVGSVIGAVVGIWLMAVGRGSSKTALPFGTYLAVAVILWLYLPPAWRLWGAP